MEDKAFPVALAVAGTELAGTAFLLWHFDSRHGGLQFAEHLGGGWLNYHLGVDGLSVLFLPLAALLALLALVYGHDAEASAERTGPPSILGYLAAVMALFSAQDMLLFWLGAAAETAVALAWLRQAPVACAQFLGGALALLLAATLLLGWSHMESTGVWSFDWADLSRQSGAASVQNAALFLLLFAFAIRLPLFPLHGWFAPALQHAGALAVAPVFLAGLKIGIYGLLRWVLPLLPQAVAHWDAYLVPVAVAGMFYGALLALNQGHVGRLLAFAMVGHNAALLLGLLTLDREGLAGTVLMSVDVGLAGALLFYAVGLIQQRTGTLWLPRLGGLFDPLPALGLAFLIAALTLMAMPGTPGFDAAHLLLEGALEVHDWGVTLAMSSANVLTAAFLLWAFQRAFLAQPSGTRLRSVRPLSRIELIAAGIPSVALLAGFYSHPWLELIDASLSLPLKPYAVSDRGAR